MYSLRARLFSTISHATSSKSATAVFEWLAVSGRGQDLQVDVVVIALQWVGLRDGVSHAEQVFVFRKFSGDFSTGTEIWG